MMRCTLPLSACLLVAFALQLTLANSILSPQSVLQPEDRKRLEAILQLNDEPVTEQTLVTVHQQLAGLNVLYSDNLNAPITSTRKQSLCDQTSKLLQTTSVKASLESLYHATSIIQLLACARPTSTDLIATLESAQKADATVDDLFRSSFGLIHLGKKPQSAKLAGLLQAALNKNDSLLANGLALQLAAHLTPVDLTASFVKRVPDLVSQADLVDSRLLQFEGGLGVTAAVLNGIYSLSNAINKPIQVTGEQGAKFTNYLLTRRTVQTVKGASELLQVLRILSNNKVQIPVLAGPTEGSAAVSSSSPVFSVKIVNALGLSLNRAFTVQLVSIDDPTQSFKLEPVQGDSTLYAADLHSSAKLSAGLHTFKLQVKPTKAESQLIAPIENQVSIVIQDEIALEDVEIAVGEKDQLALKYEQVKYPARLSRSLEVDHTQKIGVQFRVQNVRTRHNILPQQVFLQFRRRSDAKQISFLADFERSSSTYRTTISMVTRSKDFDYTAGPYDLFVLAGDSIAANAIVYHLAEITLDLPAELAPQVHVKPWLRQELTPQPELKHLFRPAEKRPPAVVSQVFTLLVLAPLPILLLTWFKIGFNLRAFRFTLSALLFHGSLALVFTLYALFFWYLNMFTTIKCLSGVLALAFLSGHRLLSSLANSSPKAD
jgi:oligosaccharyltransferase complex subunit delta (ribophorin II)